MNINRSKLLIGLAIVALNINCNEDIYSIVLPGQENLGGDRYMQNGMIASQRAYRFNTATIKKDFGQSNSIEHLNNELKWLANEQGKPMFYGISQGTATIINWLGKKSHQEQENSAAAVVLESVLCSGNSAIQHNLEKNFCPFSYLPLSRIWSFWFTKLIKFPSYKPFGIQALSSASKISPTIPVVIIHNKHDNVLPINDALRLYQTLRQNNKNAYFIEADNKINTHLDILDNDPDKDRKISALHSIYKKHNLPYNQNMITEQINLDQFQPSSENVQQKIREYNKKTNIIRNIIDIGFVSALMYTFMGK